MKNYKRITALILSAIMTVLTITPSFADDLSATDGTYNAIDVIEESPVGDDYNEISDVPGDTEQVVTDEEVVTDEIIIDDTVSEDAMEADNVEISDDSMAAAATDAITEADTMVEEIESVADLRPDFYDYADLPEMVVTQVDYVDPADIVYDCDEIYDELVKRKVETDVETEDYLTIDDVDDVCEFIEDGSISYECIPWDEYDSNLVYNKLPLDKQVTWLVLKKECDELFMYDMQDYDYTRSDFAYVSSSAFSGQDDIYNFLVMFRDSNPQYYFLKHGFHLKKESDGTYVFSLELYQNAMKGSDRTAMTDTFAAGIEEFKSNITVDPDNDYNTIKSIHDTVCDMVEYNHDAYDNNYKDEESQYVQSAYSTMVLKSTVCQGYAQGTQLLCNYYGIDCITVCSLTHAWNLVRLNDQWYNMDTTWGDLVTRISYQYFLKSRLTYIPEDAHVMYAYWNEFVPPLMQDSDSTYTDAVEPKRPTSKADMPVIIERATEDGYIYEITCATENATIYYNDADDIPDPSATRSPIYKEAVKSYPGARQIYLHAIAVCDGMYDSDITGDLVNVTYVLDGGTNSYENPTGYTKAPYGVVPLKEATNHEKWFRGWYLDPDFTQRIEEIDLTKDEDITLYAKWEDYAFYRIAFKSNGGTGAMPIQRVVCDKENTISRNTFTKVGYSFIGWNTNAYGTGRYFKDCAEIYNIASSGSTVSLYAQWTPRSYTIKFDSNGGNDVPVTDKIVKFGEAYGKLPVATKTGYAFIGWFTDPQGGMMVFPDTLCQGAATLYAHYKIVKYNIVYDGNGSSAGRMNVQSVVSGQPAVLYKNQFKKVGYSFVEWNTKANGRGRAYLDKATVKDLAYSGTVKLYAQWKRNEYSIKYVLNKGTNSEDNPKKYNVDTDTIILKKPVKKGYSFRGWYLDSKYKAGISKIPKGSTGNKVLYARWTVNKYQIKFDKNGATSGKVKNQTVAYGKKVQLRKNKYVREGYTFVGWNTKKNGKGKSYRDGAAIKNLSSKNGKVITLYAQWKKE